jgi:CHAD domain-containing protein
MSDLLRRPPEEGARLIALRQLEAALAARERLSDPDDGEALHDLRVALRRLRSTLASYRPFLAGSLGKKKRRRLRDLAATTGPGRDAEVQLAWVRSQLPTLTTAQRSGAAWLLARTTRRMEEGYAEAHEALERQLPKLAEAIRGRLSTYSTEVHLEPESPRPTFAAATGEILVERIGELRRELEAIEGSGDEERGHEARITAKRIRYLIEPLLDEMPEIAPLVKRFKALQDLLGELHDAHVFEAAAGEAVEAAAAERARLALASTLEAPPEAGKNAGSPRRGPRRANREPGLLALALRNRERRDTLFATLETRYLKGRAAGFLRELEGLAERLRAAPEGGDAGLSAGA